MLGSSSSDGNMLFGVFEVDVHSRELHKKGSRVKLQQQPFELLLTLLDRPGQVVSREELRQKLWPADVYVDFDRALNKAMVKLREALGDSSDSPLYIETLPRLGYRFIGPVNATPPALPQASSDTVRLPTEIAKPEAPGNGTQSAGHAIPPAADQSSQRRRHSALLFACGLVLLLSSSIAAAWAIRRYQSVSAPIRSLAVLPLDNLSGDPSQEYFAAGMTDELTTMLAKNSNLRIVSRTSVMQYQGARRPLPEIARALGVDGILEGSVARSSDKVHMTVQLIQGPTDTHVWAESYDRNVNDTASLPREAAQTIAKLLHSAVPQPAARFVNPEAHDAYLHGWYLWFSNKNEEAAKYFRKATEIQPDYALGWSGLSAYYGAGTVIGELDPRQALGPQKAAALKAVELDDTLAEAHHSLGAAYFLSDWDFKRAEQENDRAIQLNPKFAEAYHFRAKMFAALNRHQEAIAAQKTASELDPFERPWGLPLAYAMARQYDESIHEAQQRLVSNPGDFWVHWVLSYCYQRTGRWNEGVAELAKGFVAAGDEARAAAVRRAYQQGGYKGVSAWQLSDLTKRLGTRYVSPVQQAVYHAQLGQREETLALLEEGYRQHSPGVLFIQDDPAYDFLHSDERYRAIIKAVGLPPAY